MAVLTPDPLEHGVDQFVVVDASSQSAHVDVAVDDCIFKIVHGIADVIAQIHCLGLNAALTFRRVFAHPVENVGVVGVEAKLGTASGVDNGLLLRPGVLGAGVEAGTREVEPEALTVGAEHFRFKAREET